MHTERNPPCSGVREETNDRKERKSDESRRRREAYSRGEIRGKKS